MAKRGRPRSANPQVSWPQIRLRPDVVGKARVYASRQGLSLADYLSDRLEGPVDRDYASLLKEMAAVAGK